MRTLTLALLTATAALAAMTTAAATATATAAPPVKARITFGVGMAGATLNQATTDVKADGTLGPAPFSRWGRLSGEFCFEATACNWAVPGPGEVFIDRTGGATHRTISIGTTAPGWKTSKGVGPGTTVTTLRSRYTGLVKLTTCDLGGFGAVNKGYRYGKHAFFATSSGKVTVVYVTRQIIGDSSCD